MTHLQPLAHKQFCRAALVITPGLRGYRIALVAPETFEVIEEIPSLALAQQAHADACALWAEFTEQRKAMKGAC